MRRVTLPALLLAGCAGAPKDEVVGGSDTDLPDTDVVDVDTEVDTFPWGQDTDWVVDTDPDDTLPLGDTADTDVCEPGALAEVLAVCGGVNTVVSYVADPLRPQCPSWWGAGGVQAPTVEDALDALGCERSCVYRLSVAVMVQYCRSRGEFLIWAPDAQGQVGTGDDCPPQVEVHTVMGSGWWPSWDAYKAANPCPNGDTGTDSGDTGVDTAADTDTDLP